MQSRNCPKCGKTMTFEAGNEPTFCSNCGERLNAHHDAVAVVPDNLLNGQSGIEKQILLKKMENEARQIGFVEGTKKVRIVCGTILWIVAIILPFVVNNKHMDSNAAAVAFFTNVLLFIISLVLIFVRQPDYGWMAAPSLKKIKKTSYATVETALRAAGFSNIEALPLYDLKNSGDMRNQDIVEQITIGGKSMESGKKYPPNAKVIITYHSAENKRIF